MANLKIGGLYRWRNSRNDSILIYLGNNTIYVVVSESEELIGDTIHYENLDLQYLLEEVKEE